MTSHTFLSIDAAALYALAPLAIVIAVVIAPSARSTLARLWASLWGSAS